MSDYCLSCDRINTDCNHIAKVKLDKLGRKTIGFSYINNNGLNPAKNQVKEFDDWLSLSVSKAMRQQLRARAKKNKTTVAELVRTYIEWGLENDSK